MKCTLALLGVALVLGSGTAPSQNDIRDVASRENPVPGAFHPDPGSSSNNSNAGRGVLGLLFDDKISSSNKNYDSNSSPGGEKEGPFEDNNVNNNNNNNNNNSPDEKVAETFADSNSFDETVAEAFQDSNDNNNNLIYSGRQNPSVQVSRVHLIQANPFPSSSHWFHHRVEKTQTRASLPREGTSTSLSF